MPIDAYTLQRIAQGGQLPQNTLAGQIADRRRAAQKQQFEMKQSLMEQMRKQAATESEVKRRAHTTAREQQQDQKSRLFGVAQGLVTKARENPDLVRASLANRPGVARLLGVNPNSPTFLNDLQASRDRLYADTQGKIFEPKESERALAAPPQSPLHTALGLDADVGAEIKYVGEAPYVNEDGEVVNKENITNFEELGVTKEKIETLGGDQRAGGPLTKADVTFEGAGDFPVPEGLDMASGPRDTLVSATTRIPGLNELMKSLAGDPNYGEEERIASRVGDELENLTIMAFKPSDDGRTSKFELQLAQKLAPKLGFLTTDDSVRTDLEALHARTEAKLESQLDTANNEKFLEDTRKTAEQRALQLGKLLNLTTPLLQAAKDPRFVVENMIGKVTEDASGEEILEAIRRIPDRQRLKYLEAISPEKRAEIREAANK